MTDVSISESEQYRFELPIFDGPLDLLLHLIRKNKVDIYDIPIHLITAQYMDYLRRVEAYSLQLSTEFFELASTLLAIKAKMLLPRPVEPVEEDPREDLVQRLEEWQKVLALKKEIEAGFLLREDYLETPPVKLKGQRVRSNISLARLEKVWQRLQEVWVEEERRVMTREHVSAELLWENLSGHMKKGPVHLLHWLQEQPTRMHCITAFLVVLEMLKQNSITLAEKVDGIYVEAV